MLKKKEIRMKTMLFFIVIVSLMGYAGHRLEAQSPFPHGTTPVYINNETGEPIKGMWVMEVGSSSWQSFRLRNQTITDLFTKSSSHPEGFLASGRAGVTGDLQFTKLYKGILARDVSGNFYLISNVDFGKHDDDDELTFTKDHKVERTTVFR
ncbi:MAG: hypothetical protein FWG98_08740 [Candidatus Cloacimonetes bacterium]|nr:hypothetical protein [Candidatus Cloacimonadota bacterium]